MNKQKLAVIGCGYWGKNLVRNFHGLEALAAICESDETLGRMMADEYNVPLRAVADVLADTDIEAVVIAVPAELHHALVTDALLAGKHVFVEKPLALTAQDGTELCDLAKKQDRTLMVGHLLQYHPAFVKLKSLCSDGALGRVNYIASNRLSFGKFRINENALWSFARPSRPRCRTTFDERTASNQYGGGNVF